MITPDLLEYTKFSTSIWNRQNYTVLNGTLPQQVFILDSPFQ